MFRLLVFSFTLVEVYAGFNARAWQSLGRDFTFPEQEYADVAAKKNVGMTFSGGGDRAYIAAIGYLAAFHELGFTEDIKYIAGSSGGSWATAVFSYFQKDTVSDTVMMGPIVQPADIEFSSLLTMHPDCVRAYTNVSGVVVTGVTFSDWQDSIQSVYFTPSGITRGTPFSYDNATVADIKQRNPDLENTEFQLLRGNFGTTSGVDKRPYPIIQGAMCGPTDMIPWMPSNRNYSLMEWSPLTAGVAFTSDVTYVDINNTVSLVKTVGGFVEPYASNGNFRPSSGLPAGDKEGLLSVPGPSNPTCDLALACGTSSWVPGTAAAASTNPLVQLTLGDLKYWAPSAANPAQDYEEYATGDGAGVSNTNLISLLQRNVSTILAFVSSSTPLQNSSHWNPATDDLLEESIDFTVPAWFGQIAVNLSVVWDVGFDLPNSHIFAEEEWLPFVTDLQAAQASGKGLVLSRTHTTVTNSKYGIEAGRKVKVVWSYLGRATAWEEQLSEEMKALVVPATDPHNQANTMIDGPFKSFPHYSTGVANINIERANLLSDFTGWLVYENENIYREALGLPLLDDEVVSSDGGNDETDFGAGMIALTCALVVVALVLVIACYYYFRCRSSTTTGNNSNSADDDNYEIRSSELNGTLVKKGDVLSSSMA